MSNPKLETQKRKEKTQYMLEDDSKQNFIMIKY
jgi:hypothetical protein